MQVPLSKLTWLIQIRKLFHREESKDVRTILKEIRECLDEYTLPEQLDQDELYSFEELVDEINRYQKRILNYDDFFSIIGNMRCQQDPQQSTCVNSVSDSIQEVNLSDGKNKKHKDRYILKTQQSQSIRRSQSPINKLKIDSLHEAQQKILAKISNIESELENKQINSLKKTQLYLLKELQESEDELFINKGVPHSDLIFVLNYIKCDKITTLTFAEQHYDILIAFRNLQFLSLNSNCIKSLKGIVFEELSELKVQQYYIFQVLSLANNNLQQLEGLQKCNLQELYCQNNQINNLMHLNGMHQLKILNIASNNIQSLNQLLMIKDCKQIEFINCKHNNCIQYPEYKRIIFKMFANLKSLDKESLYQHSMVKSRQFHCILDVINFSFSQ